MPLDPKLSAAIPIRRISSTVVPTASNGISRRRPSVSGHMRPCMAMRFTLTVASTMTSDAGAPTNFRSEEHTSELQSLMRISYAVFCLKTKYHKKQKLTHLTEQNHNNIKTTLKIYDYIII